MGHADKPQENTVGHCPGFGPVTPVECTDEEDKERESEHVTELAGKGAQRVPTEHGVGFIAEQNRRDSGTCFSTSSTFRFFSMLL